MNEPSNRPDPGLPEPTQPLPTTITLLSDGLEVAEMRRRLIQAAGLIQRLSDTVKAQEETILQLRAKHEPLEALKDLALPHEGARAHLGPAAITKMFPRQLPRRQ